VNALLEPLPHTDALVLNVNDHDGARYMISRMLERAGYTVVEALTGGDAVEKARKLRPQLVVLDIKLPDLNGMEVCRLLKADEATQWIKVLHTSAVFIAPEAKVQSLNSGADGYLSHPFEHEELVATVRSLLRLQEAEKKLRDYAAELEEAGRRKSEFLAMLSHELRNPLAPMLNALEIMRVTNGQGAAAETARNMMERQLRQMVRLIDDLLDLGRVSRGKIELRRERMDIVAAVRSAVEISQPLVARSRHTLRVEAPQPLYVLADHTRLSQVFANLLNNAAKYTPPGGVIELGVACEPGGTVAVSVRDNGLGIPQSMLGKVFDIFTQVDHSREHTQGGLGIGLSIAKQLVELHEGTIEARSDGVGRGSEFTVRLPMAP
jgi:signal transduction histidine kinase